MIDKKTGLWIYNKMNEIRDFEETAWILFTENKLRGSVHLYTGEEAVAASVCAQLTDEDLIASTHRGHGHCIAKGTELDRALEAAEELAKEGISAEVIDPRTLVPFNYDTVVDSVKKTGHLVVVHEAHQNCGLGAQVVSEVIKRTFRYLDAAPIHLGAKACPLPFNPDLEAAVIPSVKEIVDACKATMYR